jgi:hypothetical protein
VLKRLVRIFEPNNSHKDSYEEFDLENMINKIENVKKQ